MIHFHFAISSHIQSFSNSAAAAAASVACFYLLDLDHMHGGAIGTKCERIKKNNQSVYCLWHKMLTMFIMSV